MVFFFGIIEFIKKKIRINLFLILIILISLIFISYNNGDNVDSPMYHLQIINWMTNYKVPLGINYLEIRYGMNSSWHNFISFFNFTLFSFKSIFFINSLLLSIITTEALNLKRKLSISTFFLFLSISFIYIFTLVHPLLNGIILNHLGNPEVDIAAMIFFIISFYLFLKIFFEEENKYLDLLIISCILTFTIKISYIAILILPLIVIFRFKFFFFICDAIFKKATI